MSRRDYYCDDCRLSHDDCTCDEEWRDPRFSDPRRTHILDDNDLDDEDD